MYFKESILLGILQFMVVGGLTESEQAFDNGTTFDDTKTSNSTKINEPETNNSMAINGTDRPPEETNLLTTLLDRPCPLGYYWDYEFGVCQFCMPCRPCNGSVKQEACLGQKFECGKAQCYADGCSAVPCAHGTCRNNVSSGDYYSYTCDCSTWWTGTNCTEKVICLPFYYGDRCQHLNIGLVIGITIGTMIIGLILIICALLYKRRNRDDAEQPLEPLEPLNIPEWIPEIFTQEIFEDKVRHVSFEGVHPKQMMAIGLGLGINKARIEGIQVEHEYNGSHEQTIKLLRTYQEEFGDDAKIRDVLKALYENGHKELVQDIIKELKSTEEGTSGTSGELKGSIVQHISQEDKPLLVD